MKIKYMMWIVLVSCYAGIAHAETVSGTVTSIDSPGKNFTLRRADTNAMMTVHVSDSTMLGGLAPGKETSLDAASRGGIWEAQSFNTVPEPTSGKLQELNS